MTLVCDSADLPGEFAHGQSGGFPQLAQIGLGCHEFENMA